MSEFSVVSGRLTESNRFINVPLRWFEQHPARERREIWLSTADGEVQLVVHSRRLPLRCGHHAAALVAGPITVGIANMTTGTTINFLRADPPLVWRRRDSVVLAGLLAGVLVFALASFALLSMGAAVAAVCGTPIVLISRMAQRTRLQVSVDRSLARLIQGRDQALMLRRVK